MIEVKVHFLKESGKSFAEISNELKLSLQEVALYYVKAVEARKYFDKRDTRRVVYRKRINETPSERLTKLKASNIKLKIPVYIEDEPQTSIGV